MINYIKDPYKTIFTGPSRCKKSHLDLDLIEKEYHKHFEYIIIIGQCSNGTIHIMFMVRSDMIRMFDLEPLSLLLPLSETWFIIDDIIADKIIDKCRQFLLNLTISGRHRHHFL